MRARKAKRSEKFLRIELCKMKKKKKWRTDFYIIHEQNTRSNLLASFPRPASLSRILSPSRREEEFCWLVVSLSLFFFVLIDVIKLIEAYRRTLRHESSFSTRIESCSNSIFQRTPQNSPSVLLFCWIEKVIVASSYYVWTLRAKIYIVCRSLSTVHSAP